MMKGARANIIESIGNTPIVKLNKVASHVKSDIYVKLEYLNPGGSMKDRVALNIIHDAERRGRSQPGSTITEATAGNTGPGLAPIAALYSESGKTGRPTKPCSYYVEGLGEDFRPGTMNLKIIDSILRVDDKECFLLTREVVRQEGIFCGGSSGAAVAGAIKYAEQL